MKKELDQIIIRDLKLRCVIGIFDEERKEKQDIKINIVMYSDLSKPCKTDNIEDSVDYKKIKKEIIKMVESSKFFLIEKLAGSVAEICLTDQRIKKAEITLDKPGALRFAKSAAVKLIRYNE